MPLFNGNDLNYDTYSTLEAPTSLIILQQTNSTIYSPANTPTTIFNVPQSLSVFSNIFIFGEFDVAPTTTYFVEIFDIIRLDVEATGTYTFTTNPNISYRGYSFNIKDGAFFLSVTASLISLYGLPLTFLSNQGTSLYSVMFSAAYVQTPGMQLAQKPGTADVMIPPKHGC